MLNPFRRLVASRGFTLKSLAEASQVDYWRIIQHSSGKTRLAGEPLDRVAETLAVAADDIPSPTWAWEETDGPDAA